MTTKRNAPDHEEKEQNQLHVSYKKRTENDNTDYIYMPLNLYNNSNNILYSPQWEIKAVIQSYALTHNEELNCTHLNN